MDTQKPCCGNCLYHIKTEKGQTACRFNPPTVFVVNNAIISGCPVVPEDGICGQWHIDFAVMISSSIETKRGMSGWRRLKTLFFKSYKQYRRDEAIQEAIEKQKMKDGRDNDTKEAS